MRSEELMLGDLVTFKECQNDEKPVIIKIWEINADGDAFVSIDGDDVLDEISIDDEVVGIPLTEEILRDNFPAPSDGLTWFPDGGGFNCHTYVPDYEINAFGHFKYVHELQHALRLCGIDKAVRLWN